MPNYRVVFHDDVTRTYIIPDCRTPEEASDIAMGMTEDETEDFPASVTNIDYLSDEVEEIEEEV